MWRYFISCFLDVGISCLTIFYPKNIHLRRIPGFQTHYFDLDVICPYRVVTFYKNVHFWDEKEKAIFWFGCEPTTAVRAVWCSTTWFTTLLQLLSCILLWVKISDLMQKNLNPTTTSPHRSNFLVLSFSCLCFILKTEKREGERGWLHDICSSSEVANGVYPFKHFVTRKIR